MTVKFAEQRVSAHHLQRIAIVYPRQSSPYQLVVHTESTRIQRGLVEQARALGWPEALVIDDDLGTSAGGFAERPGFQRMLALVATRKAGVLLCFDASRLARSSPDWAHLFQLCGCFDTLVADLSQVYDLAFPNDRLVLGIKAVISEMELTTMKQRMREGVESKASRGEYRFMLPAGYEHDHADRIVMASDQVVRKAIANVFVEFEQARSIRQLALRYRDAQTRVPVRRRPVGGQRVVWVIPTIATISKILHNPTYAGAYVWGRSRLEYDYVDGVLRKRVVRGLRVEDARVFIKDHHPEYIAWEQYEANLAKIADNRARWGNGRGETRGAVRKGKALLPGLLRCGHCGRKMNVSYSGGAPTYYCHGGEGTGMMRCMNVGAVRVDRAVSKELCVALQPLSVQAATEAEALRARDHERIVEQERLHVKAARYEVDRALDQYDHVDPKNRLVADTLEERLNDRLRELQEAEERLAAVVAECEPLSEAERSLLSELGEHFRTVWNHPETDVELRKQILRTALEEITLTVEAENERIEVVIHWKGGVHTRCHVRRRSPGRGAKADAELVETVRQLACGLDDGEIARVLNRNGIKTPRGCTWAMERVKHFRKHHRIRHEPRDPNVLSGLQAAVYLGVSPPVVEKLARLGHLDRNQALPYAPWAVTKEQLDSAPVQVAVRNIKEYGRMAAHGDDDHSQLSMFPEGDTQV